MEYQGSLVLRVHKDQLVQTATLDPLDQRDRVASLEALDSQEIEVSAVTGLHLDDLY